jgi:hypothetical protein
MMSSTQQNSVSHANNNSHHYSDPRSIITVVLWGAALATHAILIPRLVRELYGDFAKHRS